MQKIYNNKMTTAYSRTEIAQKRKRTVDSLRADEKEKLKNSIIDPNEQIKIKKQADSEARALNRNNFKASLPEFKLSLLWLSGFVIAFLTMIWIDFDYCGVLNALPETLSIWIDAIVRWIPVFGVLFGSFGLIMFLANCFVLIVSLISFMFGRIDGKNIREIKKEIQDDIEMELAAKQIIEARPEPLNTSTPKISKVPVPVLK